MNPHLQALWAAPCAHEIDFFPVGSGSCSGGAASMRWIDAAGQHVMVYDAGYRDTGEMMCDHIRRRYGTQVIDDLVCSHLDNDHMGGVPVVLENMLVRRLWVLIPAWFGSRLPHLFAADWTPARLGRHLERQFDLLTDALEIARQRGTRIVAPLARTTIGRFVVLSPTVPFYTSLLAEFRDTPQPSLDAGSILAALRSWSPEPTGRFQTEDWFTETLPESASTSPENEASVVLYGEFGNGGVLLTGDAGVRGLDVTLAAAHALSIDLPTRIRTFQVPHHGSRRNITPSLLNQLVGPPVALPIEDRTAVVQAGADDSEHPRPQVTNALHRRGLSPVVTRGDIIRIGNNMPPRSGWDPVKVEPFKPRVEVYR